MSNVSSLKKRLMNLLIHCDKPAEKCYGVKFDIKLLTVNNEKNRFAYLRRYQPNSLNNSKTCYEESKVDKNKKEIKTKSPLLNFTKPRELKSSYTIVERTYLSRKKLMNRKKQNKDRSLSNADNKKLRDSLSNALSPLSNQYILIVGLNKFLTLDKTERRPHTMYFEEDKKSISQESLSGTEERSASIKRVRKIRLRNKEKVLSDYDCLKDSLQKIEKSFTKFKINHQKLKDNSLISSINTTEELLRSLEEEKRRAEKIERELAEVKNKLKQYETNS